MKILCRRARVPLAALVLSWISTGSALGQPWNLGPPERVSGNAGAFEALDGATSLEMGWELQFSPRRIHLLPRSFPDLIPTMGTLATSKGTLYVYGGLRLELPLGERWTISPGTAAGLYYRDNGKNLGAPLEFRSHLELAYRLSGAARLGLCFYHLSNGGLFDFNPGTESVILTWSASLRAPHR